MACCKMGATAAELVRLLLEGNESLPAKSNVNAKDYVSNHTLIVNYRPLNPDIKSLYMHIYTRD